MKCKYWLRNIQGLRGESRAKNKESFWLPGPAYVENWSNLPFRFGISWSTHRERINGYDEFALFFHDTYGGTLIGVLLKPQALEMKDFKVSNINGRKYNADGRLFLNLSAMIQDFYILGNGLVDSIDVRSKRFALT
ncbi:nucleolar protein 6-like [Ceratina calcarata]|uniref:Nucleolar protein 6-like n=1 Tax=Ceratina calcarata TaxID=156304 RepID=A0AAJ7RY08_9HYME|nr:nucleolar protein 6-like [Ceratina calcarata]